MHPNPLFRRDRCTVLDRGWACSINGGPLQPIRIPFCPQSRLSGIAYAERIRTCRYRVTFSYRSAAPRTVLHFGAVDYEAVVTLNGRRLGSHRGGYTPFAFDVTSALIEGENELIVEVYDENEGIPFGKQTYRDRSFGCFYTPTTGIWQPVWLEDTPAAFIREVYLTPNAAAETVTAELLVSGHGRYTVDVLYEGRPVGQGSGDIAYRGEVTIPLCETHLWSLGQGALYDVVCRYEDDTVRTYFGLRDVCYDAEGRFRLNGKDTFQRLVLDQGYDPDGLYTMPSEEAMQRDIALGMRLGFNGARLHQKLFDPRYLYFCDRMGYMVWGEFPSWGVDYGDLTFLGQFLSEWEEALRRDYNHPCIVHWCPLNEAWGDWGDSTKKRDVRFVDAVFAFTKRFDASRPVVDVSGGHHGHGTDLYDFHSYEPYETLKGYLDRLETEGVLDAPLLYCEGETLRYEGGPVNLSECGGFSFGADIDTSLVDTVNECAVMSEDAWGYGAGEQDGDRYVERVTALLAMIGQYRRISGYCYTQLYDVEQEQNGFYRYDRSDKLTETQKDAIRAAQERIGTPLSVAE